jgi:hypothetical protein
LLDSLIDCLKGFGTKSSVFQFAIQKFKNSHIQNYNFVSLFSMSVKFADRIDGEIYADGVRE